MHKVIDFQEYKDQKFHGEKTLLRNWITANGFDEDSYLILVLATLVNQVENNEAETYRYEFLIKCRHYCFETREERTIRVRFPAKRQETIKALRRAFPLGKLALAHGKSCSPGEHYPFYNFDATHFSPIPSEYETTGFACFRGINDE